MPETNLRLTYFGYTHDETRDSIERQFVRRFGHQPAAIFQSTGGDWWAGPVLMVTMPTEIEIQSEEAMA